MESEEALRLSVIRGKLMSECPKGGMTTVFASVENFQSLPKEIVIATENGPQMTVFGGSYEALRSFIHTLDNIDYAHIPISYAFLSPLMQGAADGFVSEINTSRLSILQDIQFISTLSGKVESKDIQTAEYWSN